MGFCRRCGDILNSQRCNICGGSAVAPTVSWSQGTPHEYQDRWSKTYVHRGTSTPKSPVDTSGSSVYTHPPSPVKRFPRPIGAHITGSASLDNQITHHIASTASQSARSISPLKPTVTGPKPESGILPSLNPNDTTLSKVYGSVLQPKESLAMHCCALCTDPFLPDATIYPDPSLPASDEPRFLCRQCFIVSGGSKGLCPNCDKPVTILKMEGGFVYAADKYWHKKCFKCEGCSKNIGDSPMVDLLGRPSCSECFDTCLSRDRTPKRPTDKHKRFSVPSSGRNPGGFDLSSNTPNKPHQSSPAIEELEQRFGISKSREGSPAIEELSQRLNSIGRDCQIKYSNPSSPAQIRQMRLEGSPSPVRRVGRFVGLEFDDLSDVKPFSTPGTPRRTSGSPVPTTEAIEEMKKRFLRHSTVSPTFSPAKLPESCPTTSVSLLQRRLSPVSLKSSPSSKIPIPIPLNEPTSPTSSTSDFTSDSFDTLTQSSFSGVDSPTTTIESLCNRLSRCGRTETLPDVIIEETKSRLNTPSQTSQSTIKLRPCTVAGPIKPPPNATQPLTRESRDNTPASTVCAKCQKPLFTLKEGGKFVAVPSDDTSDTTHPFHIDCFKCTFCNDVFNQSSNGQAIFMKSNAGPAHLECAPLEKIFVGNSPSEGSSRLSQERPQPMSDRTSIKASPSPRKSGGNQSSSRYEHLSPIAAANTASPPRFGSRTACPGCHKSVSPMERGVVPGPQGSKWHAECLVCGGKRPPSRSNSWMLGRGEEKRKEPGCGKKLDSAAKTDSDGRIWCRQCLLMVRIEGSPGESLTQAPYTTTQEGKSTPLLTGTTTLARQFTGLGNGDTALLKQLTGGSISPTRSLSPTKQLGTAVRQRPKSVIGMRSSKSIDEGRGMFLVRQLTGASTSNLWDD